MLMKLKQKKKTTGDKKLTTTYTLLQASKMRASRSILGRGGQQHYINCIAWFFQNLSTFSGCFVLISCNMHGMRM